MSRTSFDLSPQGVYFSILRSSVWGTPVDTSKWEGTVDWQSILDNFSQQRLLPFVAKAMNSLSGQYSLTLEQKDTLITASLRNQQEHHKIRKAIVEVFSALEDAGCHPILLKGEGLEAIYPHKGTRTVGDIDLFVADEEYDAAISKMIEICGYEPTDIEQKDYHYEIHYGTTVVEVHHEPAYIGEKKDSLSVVELAKQWLTPEKCDEITINDKKILIPGKLYNLFYTFHHLCNHWKGNVGIRQFIDILYLIDKNKDYINFPELIKWCETNNLGKAWNYTLAILRDYLGLALPDGVAIGNISKTNEQYLIQTMVEAGDLGHDASNNPFDRFHNLRGIVNAYKKAKKQSILFSPTPAPILFVRNLLGGINRVNEREI